MLIIAYTQESDQTPTKQIWYFLYPNGILDFVVFWKKVFQKNIENSIYTQRVH